MASKRFMKRIVDDERGPSPISADTANTKPVVSRKKSGKRSLAAYKTWEKRRAKQAAALAKAESEKAAVVTSMEDVVNVSKVPPEDDSSAPGASNNTVSMNTSNKRSLAAYKTWEKRRAKQAAALAKAASIIPPIDDERDTSPAEEEGDDASESVASSPSRAGDKMNKRRLAALKSWEKRRKKQAKNTSIHPDKVSSVAEDASGADAEEEDTDDAGVSASGYVRKHKKGYTAELRSQAAKTAWERRKRLKEARQQSTAHDVTDISEEDSATSKPVESKQSQKAAAKKRKRWDEVPESKRSNPRRTSQEVDGIDEAIKDANQVITRLKHSRNWMEFHPSSRYGNGTADYAYIPGSLAQLIRNGAFSKPIVMEHGTLGIHYALDYEGYGGLKEMIETFGEDYAPCPTDKMMEASLEMQEKKETKVEQWDLGEDLPWQEVAEIEDARINALCKDRKKELKAEIGRADVTDDIEEIADILASLCDVQDAPGTKSPTAAAMEVTKKYIQTPATRPTKPNSTYSPALNALCGYDSESSCGTSDDSSDEEEPQPIDSIVTSKTSVDMIESNSNTETIESSSAQPLYYNESNQEEDAMFGVPLYNPNQMVAQYPINEYSQEQDCHNNTYYGAPLSNQEIQPQNNQSTTHQSSEDGIHFIQDNRKVMLLAPPEEEEEEKEE